MGDAEILQCISTENKNNSVKICVFQVKTVNVISGWLHSEPEQEALNRRKLYYLKPTSLVN